MFRSVLRVVYRVPDVVKARDWYKQLLESDPVLDSPFLVMFVIGETALILIPKENQDEKQSDQTVAYWKVDDIKSAYQKLLDLGAVPGQEITSFMDISVAKVTDPFGNIIGITGQKPAAAERTVEHRPSESAMTTALCRALAFKDERIEIKGGDYLAEIFLGEDALRTLRDKASREYVIKKLLTAELYSYFLARTAYIDNIFLQALQNNIPQIVLTGAGYDSRPYRFKDKIGSTRIFELDIETTQRRKREMLDKAGITAPEQLTYVPVNFKTGTMEEALCSASFDKTALTLFIWEGVSYYLPEDAVDNTLKFIKGFSAPGSTLCFDYLIREIGSAYADEPFLFWKSEKEMKEYLYCSGFKLKEHLIPQEIENRFLTLNDGSAAGKVIPLFCFALAETV